MLLGVSLAVGSEFREGFGVEAEILAHCSSSRWSRFRLYSGGTILSVAFSRYTVIHSPSCMPSLRLDGHGCPDLLTYSFLLV